MKFQQQHIFKSKLDPKKGCMLLADPLLDEAFFQRAVVLLIDHSVEESFGIVLNHVTNVKLNDLFEDIDLDLPVFNGGPVSTQQLFYLHRFSQIEGSIKVGEALYFGGNWQQIIERTKAMNKPHLYLRIFAGYSGWGAQQLENEVSEQAWLCISQTDGETLFNIKVEDLWKRFLLNQGPEFKIFAHFPLQVSDN